MAEDAARDLLDILRRGERTTTEKRRCACTDMEPERGAGACAHLDCASQVFQMPGSRVARGAYDVEDVFADLLVAIDAIEGRLESRDFLRRHHGLDFGTSAGGEAVHDAALVVAGGVGNDALEHETVNLRLRQRIGSLLLDGVLRREDEEGRRKVVGGVANRHAALLHGLQKGALHLCGGAVDFIGEQEVGEDRSLARLEGAVLLIVDEGADHIGRQQVRRKGNPLETETQGLRQRLDGRRLGQAGNAFQ